MLSSSVRRGVVRRLLGRGLSRSLASSALQVASLNVKKVLESSIARREPSHALAAFVTLQQEAGQTDQQLLQRLVLLLAKHGQPHEVARAAQLLCHLLAQPSCIVNDTTQLAAIYTLDSCLQLRRLEDALLLFQAAKAKSILVDLPAVNAMLKALVDAHRVDEAVALVKSIITQHEVRPTEKTFQSVLVALMKQKRYEDVVSLIEHGRENAVDFTPQTYDLLVNRSQEQYAIKDDERLNKLMEYINDALLVDGYWDDDDDEEDEDRVEFDDDDNDFDDDDFD